MDAPPIFDTIKESKICILANCLLGSLGSCACETLANGTQRSKRTAHTLTVTQALYSWVWCGGQKLKAARTGWTDPEEEEEPPPRGGTRGRRRRPLPQRCRHSCARAVASKSPSTTKDGCLLTKFPSCAFPSPPVPSCAEHRRKYHGGDTGLGT